MFDIGWQELFIVAVLALIVVGPKDLPKTIKTVMTWVRKARSMARDFQSGVDEMVREAELDEVKKNLTEGGNELKKDLEKNIGADDLTKDLNLSDDVAEKVASNNLGDQDVTDIIEPADDAEAKNKTAEAAEAEATPIDDDDDVMPIASPNKTEQKS